MTVKSDRLDVRLTQAHKRLIEKAALVTGQSVTSFIMSSALDRARDALERESRTVLSKRDARTFLRTLEKLAVPAPALVRAVKRAGRPG